MLKGLFLALYQAIFLAIKKKIQQRREQKQ